MFVCACLVACSCGRPAVILTRQAPPTLGGEPGGYERAVVERVIDGDTVEVRITGRVPGEGLGRARIGGSYDVRLVGIDTPESVAPGEPVERVGREASEAAEALLEGREVFLVVDVEEEDSFGRLLRYVYMGAEMANARLVVNGYAHAYRYPPNVRHSALFGALQRHARSHDAGLWAAAGCAS